MKRLIPDEIRNPDGERLDFTYHPGAEGVSALVVIGHGVTGNKDRPVLVTLAETLAGSGVHALRFSFAGNGGSEGRFEDCTVSKEVGDLGAVLDSLPGWHVGYAGHSMGAAVGVLRAAADKRLRFLLSLAGMVRTADFAEREFGAVTPGEGCMWDEPACPLSRAFVDDMNRIGDVLDAAREVRAPWLLLHGDADDVVPIQDSRDAHAAAVGPKRLIELPGADHVFSEGHAATLSRDVVAWIRRLKL